MCTSVTRFQFVDGRLFIYLFILFTYFYLTIIHRHKVYLKQVTHNKENTLKIQQSST